MPYYVDKSTLQVSKITDRVKYIPELLNLTLYSDTEFTEKLRMIIDAIGLYSPTFDPNGAVIFTYEELTRDFNPIIDYLSLYGDVRQFTDEDETAIAQELSELSKWIQISSEPARNIKRQYEEALISGHFDPFLKRWNIGRDNIKYVRANKTSNVQFTPKKIFLSLRLFYAFADLFKIFGGKHQYLLLTTHIVQFRTLRFTKTLPAIYLYFNNVLYEIVIDLREVMYRFPTRKMGLANQAKTFGLPQAKMDISTIASKLLKIDQSEVYTNMTRLRIDLLDEFLRYNGMDLFITAALDETHSYFLKLIQESFELEPSELKDTTGANVSEFLKKLIYKHFGVEQSELIDILLKLTQIDNLQEIPLNNYGIQPFLTVGGLLYTRMSKHPFIKGTFSDADLVSCYASIMSRMNIYLGQPVVVTFKYKRYKPTLKEIIEFIEHKQIADDAWFVRVSGELTNAVNTLVLSDLRFEPKKITKPTNHEFRKDKQLITNFNREKTSKKQAVSTLLQKEIKFGLITIDLLEAIKLLPEDWVEEYLNLRCEVLVYYPPELIGDTVDEVNSIKYTLPEEAYKEQFDARNGLNTIVSQYYKDNATLRFPINKYWDELKTKRKKFKDEKNPVQEVYKLFGNSGYGVLACLHLATNNLIASNYITAAARTNTWMMINGLNGFSAITDGCTFPWKQIPLGKTFQSVLAKYPNYLTHFEPNIKSGLAEKDWNQGWFNTSFKQHLADFFQISVTHKIIERFDYELKEEEFTTKKGWKWLTNNQLKSDELKEELGDKDWKKYLLDNGYIVNTTIFTRYANTNAGNYAKGIDGYILIDGNEYDFNPQEPFVKARSFPGSDVSLIEHFIDSLQNKYSKPFVCAEKKIIKFGDGNAIAIKFLNEGITELAHPMGFTTTAFKIMKLISRSQFLFLTERQLKNFETNEETLSNLSLELLRKPYWDKLPVDELRELGAELIEGIDYYEFSRTHSVGIGFELLALAPRTKGSIKVVRENIDTKIQNGCTDFNAALNLSKYKSLGKAFENLFASIIIQKANAEYLLKQKLIASANEPTILTVTPMELSTIENDWYESNEA